MSRMPCFLGAALALAFAAGCITRSPATEVRFFEPPAISWEEAHFERDVPTPGLALVRVTSVTRLARPMVWRRSEVEIVFDERHRWASEPAALVEQALRDALFVRGPYRASEVRGAARLEVRLTELEGDLTGPRRARVALIAALTLPDAPTRTRRFEAEAPLERGSPEALAGATGQALELVVLELRAWLDAELGMDRTAGR